MEGTEDLEQKDIIIDGVNYDYVQLDSKNPVTNPPFNNWSVNQPAVPHANGLAGKADLGQNIIVDGHAVHFAQATEPGMHGNEDLGEEITIDGMKLKFAQKKNQGVRFAQAT